MVQPPEEKRMAPRHSYTFPVTYTGKVGTPAMPPQEVLFQGKIVDLSSGGIGKEARGHSFLESGATAWRWEPIASARGDVAGQARAVRGGGNDQARTRPVGP